MITNVTPQSAATAEDIRDIKPPIEILPTAGRGCGNC